MNKLWLIIQREYLTRVKRRSFILTTLLTPLAFAVFFVVVGFIFSYESDDTKYVAVVDQANIIPPQSTIPDERNLSFSLEDRSIEELRAGLAETDYDGILLIPPVKNLYANSYTIYYYSDQPPSIDIETLMKQRVEHLIREYKIEKLELKKEQLQALDSRVELDPEPLAEGEDDASKISSAIGAGLGVGMGFIMYMAVFIYGMMVMRSVMEEKTNRIVEVMISSVKPFQLMLGKIIGVGGVGLTQIAIWAILIPLISMLVNLAFGFEASQMDNMPANSDMEMEEMQGIIGQAYQELRAQSWWTILPSFLFFFLGGYFLYSSLFAAVGSAMGDDMGEGQSLTIPITIPIIIAFYIMFVTIQAPNSSLAIWSSIFPLFSPIVMPARLAFEPPVWQILLSMTLLAATAVFFIWLAGRIYRVGILMYGKKVTFRELAKWMFYRE